MATLSTQEEVRWVGADGKMVSGTFDEHDAFMAAERANPAQAVARIEAKIEEAKVTAPAAVVERVQSMTSPQLRGLARAVAARHAELKLDQPKGAKAPSAGHRTAFTGSTGLARACSANRNFRVAASSPKAAPKANEQLTGIARAIAANKRRQK